MRITGSQVGPVTPAQQTQIKKIASSTSVEKARATDEVVFSSQVANIDAARNVIANSPDIRQEKVEALRRAIQDGTYQVDADKIAERILAEGRLIRIGRK